MKLELNHKYKQYNGLEQQQMGLDADNTSHLMSLLRNNIYSNPIKSIVREYYSNAIDAHKKAGVTKIPIEININDEEFIVRDYGNSMTKEVIYDVYIKMGKSDKRDSNNLHGGWGLGCKSALSYVDHFYIETYTKEEQELYYRKWVMYIDNSQIGAISLLTENKIESLTKLYETGTIITIPILKNDKNAFLTYICYYLSFTNNKYILKDEGKEIPFNSNDYRKELKLYCNNWGLTSGNNSFRNKSSKSVAIIEDIPYQVNVRNILNYLENVNENYLLNDIKDKSNLLKTIKRKELLINFIGSIAGYEYEIALNIGELDVSASREDLQYTEKTCRSLSITFYKMLLDIIYMFKIHCINNVSYYKACRLSHLYSIQNIHNTNELFSIFNWKNKPGYSLYANTFKISGQDLYYTKYKISSDKLKSSEQHSHNISFTYEYIFCKNDVEECKSVNRYIKYYLLNHVNNCYNTNLLFFNIEEFNKLDNELEQDFKIVLLSEIIKLYKEEHKKEKVDKAKQESISKEYVNVLQFKEGSVVRPNCANYGTYFDYEPTLIKDDCVRYYLTLEDSDDKNENKDFKWDQELIYDSLFKDKSVKFLCDYLDYKEIPYRDLYLIKKKTRTYNNKSWVNLSTIVKQDYKLYKDEIPKVIFYSFLSNLYKNNYCYSYDYGINIFSALKDYSHNITNKLYKQLNNIFIEAVDFMNDSKNQFLINFCFLASKEVRYILYHSFIKSNELQENPIYILCKEIIELEKELKNKIPLLNYFEINKDNDEYYDAYVQYINFFINEERNDLDKFKFKEPSLSWNYNLLCNKYINKL